MTHPTTMRINNRVFYKNADGDILVQWLGHGGFIESDPEPRPLRNSDRQELALAILDGKRWSWVPSNPTPLTNN